MSKWDEKARNALIRMSNAYDRGKGVRLSWEELEVMNRTFIGQTWCEVRLDHDLPEPPASANMPA